MQTSPNCQNNLQFLVGTLALWEHWLPDFALRLCWGCMYCNEKFEIALTQTQYALTLAEAPLFVTGN